VIEASSTSRADIVSSVSVSDASAWLARGEVLIKATGFARKFLAADQPIERVLHHAGHAAGIFGARNQKPVGRTDDSSKACDFLREAFAFEIGVEERKVVLFRQRVRF